MKVPALILLLLYGMNSFAQEDQLKSGKFTLSGYIVEMPWVTYYNDFKTREYTNLVHNRLNAKWTYGESVIARLEIRNRFYSGDQVENNPGFAEQLSSTNSIDLSKTWYEGSSSVLHSNIERLSLEYRKAKWNVRAGRQRINWAMANFWNPNDIFNYYNILDFDYPERPGSDAIKLQYLAGDFSNIEGAVAVENDQAKTALKYSTNYHNYDIQFIGGYYPNTVTAGLGWAGSISSLGFKGEIQYYKFNDSDTSSDFNFSLETDYVFNSGYYVAAAMLYNGNGLNEPLNPNTPLLFQTSSSNLMPAKWNTLLVVSKEITPLLSGVLDVIYSPGINMLILFPTVSYNVGSNFDLSLVWQSFFAETGESFKAMSHATYVRLRWSF